MLLKVTKNVFHRNDNIDTVYFHFQSKQHLKHASTYMCKLIFCNFSAFVFVTCLKMKCISQNFTNYNNIKYIFS